MNIVRPFFYKHKPMVDDLEERITEVLDNVRMEDVCQRLNIEHVLFQHRVHPTPEPKIKSSSRLKTSKMAISKIFKRAKHK
ncbi:hypothetical protein scyTo_0007850 [Scyliorhinus torazame]|uniref:Uncharacterized protein n=1 Tax=Scyliorhinus torazame TaxID=75743 RepID=A0A401NZH5_SCYTO|nr:hypothetical protein [Scyliorhinus torazame]